MKPGFGGSAGDGNNGDCGAGLMQQATRDFRVKIRTARGTLTGGSRGTLRLAEKPGKQATIKECGMRTERNR